MADNIYDQGGNGWVPDVGQLPPGSGSIDPEVIQDTVAEMLAEGDHENIEVVYDDVEGSISLISTGDGGTSDFPTVKDYGAVGDGTSCLAAFQASLAATGVAVVPAGDYQLEATLELAAEQTLLLMPGAEIFPLASGGTYLTHTGEIVRQVMVKLTGIASKVQILGNARVHLRSRTNFAAFWAIQYDHLIEGGLVLNNTPGTPIAGQAGVIYEGHSSRVLKTQFNSMDIGILNYGSGANGCEYRVYTEEGNVGIQIDNGPASNISSVHITNCILNLPDVCGVRIYSRSRDLLGVSIAQCHFEGLVAGQNLVRLLPGTGAGGYVALGVTSSIFLNQNASSGTGIKVEDGCDAMVTDCDFGSLANGIHSISSFHLTAHGNRFAGNVPTPITWPGTVHRIDRGDPYGTVAVVAALEAAPVEDVAGVLSGVLAIDVREFGAKLDANQSGTTGTDDTAAWNAAFAAAAAETLAGIHISTKITAKPGKYSKISDSILIPSRVGADLGDTAFVYVGSMNRPIIRAGEVGVANQGTHYHFGSVYNWTADPGVAGAFDQEYIAIAFWNPVGCVIHVRKVMFTTVGIGVYGGTGPNGYTSHNEIHLGQFIDCQYCVDTGGRFGGTSYANEDTYYKGNLTGKGGVHLDKSCYGMRYMDLDPDGSGKINSGTVRRRSGSNIVLHDPCFQLKNGTGGAERIPLLDYCGGVRGYGCRIESGGPVAIKTMAGAYRASRLELGYHEGTTITNVDDGGKTGAYAVPVRYSPPVVPSISSGFLPDQFYETDGLGALSTSELWMYAITSTTQLNALTTAQGVIRNLADRHLELANNIAVGFMLDVSDLPCIGLKRSLLTSFPGRPCAIGWDSAGVVLDIDSPTTPLFRTIDVTAADTANRWVSSADNNYPDIFFYNDKLSIKRLFIGTAGGTAVGKIREVSLYSPSGAPLRIIPTGRPSGQKYATAVPTTADNGIVYTRGETIDHLVPVVGQPQGWKVLGSAFQGLACGTAWAINTVYAVGNRRYNVTNVYEVSSITGTGTSAASGGPTGTGSAIVDNEVTWKYVAPRMTFQALPNL